jgi:AbrB family looped-hinge helix DNA binding protein
MDTTTSRLTKKYQATIPEPVRNLLHLKAGDYIVFTIEGNEIRLRKAQPMDSEFARALSGTLSEWSSENDEAAYRDL